MPYVSARTLIESRLHAVDVLNMHLTGRRWTGFKVDLYVAVGWRQATRAEGAHDKDDVLQRVNWREQHVPHTIDVMALNLTRSRCHGRSMTALFPAFAGPVTSRFHITGILSPVWQRVLVVGHGRLRGIYCMRMRSIKSAVSLILRGVRGDRRVRRRRRRRVSWVVVRWRRLVGQRSRGRGCCAIR